MALLSKGNGTFIEKLSVRLCNQRIAELEHVLARNSKDDVVVMPFSATTQATIRSGH